ncbi:MAG: class I SAM-dependent methyltransferase [Candidatus Omnitrophica bacterium]|nr:class I SAM-dependent methyltransferase [Candidatus Omnitrophota bacterium]
MAVKNIQYKTKQISEYFTTNRIKWGQFYPSEKWIFEKVAGTDGKMGKILDVGCAAGGLGLALRERFFVSQYVGVDINAPAIEEAQKRKVKKNCPSQFICGDILDIHQLPAEKFDNVFSLSCADWNKATEDIISECWKYVRVGGHFILTLRLTPQKSLLTLSESFQYIYFGKGAPEKKQGIEKAPYIVLNASHAFSLLSGLQPKPDRIMAYGYWGAPSRTARTKYDRLVFTALAVRKSDHNLKDVSCELHLPADLFIRG